MCATLFIFAFIGLSSVGCSIILMSMMLKDFVKDQIDIAKYRHKIKHRFDGPPTAKCYCKDCDRYELDVKYCNKFSHYASDSEFCCWAIPRKYDPEKED